MLTCRDVIIRQIMIFFLNFCFCSQRIWACAASLNGFRGYSS